MEKMKKKYFIISGILLILVSACAATQTNNPGTVNPEQLVAQLGAELSTAKDNQVDVLAPNWYAKANASYAKAKKALKEEKKMSDIRHYVTEATMSLNKAEEFSRVSKAILGKTNEARNKAIGVRADKLGEPYVKVEKQYLKLTDAIENDKMSYAQKNAAKVQAAYQNIEIMAIKNNALGSVRSVMADAKNQKLYKRVPSVYLEAENALNDADDFIEKNPYESKTIQNKTEKAAFMARRLMSVNHAAKKIEDMTPEASALHTESLLTRLGTTMGTLDIRDKAVDDQVSTLTDTTKKLLTSHESLKVKNQSYQSQLGKLEERLSSLKGISQQQEAAKNKLTVEREFNDRFNKVQQYFEPREAEVYKQGSRLVIRMRGISFPVGQATLTTENYGLLKKVQQAIRTFDQPAVTIEGHTDSTGSTEKNLMLSQKRAEAVEAYLIANDTLLSSQLKAIGYGPDRPLAPNSTKEGRSVNRRIDVLITPTQLM